MERDLPAMDRMPPGVPAFAVHVESDMLCAMIDEITRHREDLQALCRRSHVLRLELFGSAARGDFDSRRSDIDFLVEFDRQCEEAFSLKAYFDFKKRLEALLGRSVDLVEPNELRNPYLKASIDQARELLFAA
jgi:uncharacterized protein